MEKFAEYQPVLGEIRSTYVTSGSGNSVERPVVWDGERWIDMLTPEYHQLIMRMIADAKPHQH